MTKYKLKYCERCFKRFRPKSPAQKFCCKECAYVKKRMEAARYMNLLRRRRGIPERVRGMSQKDMRIRRAGLKKNGLWTPRKYVKNGKYSKNEVKKNREERIQELGLKLDDGVTTKAEEDEYWKLMDELKKEACKGK